MYSLFQDKTYNTSPQYLYDLLVLKENINEIRIAV